MSFASEILMAIRYNTTKEVRYERTPGKSMKFGTVQSRVCLAVCPNGDDGLAVIATVVMPWSRAMPNASRVRTTVPDTDVPITRVFFVMLVWLVARAYLLAVSALRGSVDIFVSCSNASSVAIAAMCESPHPVVIMWSMLLHISFVKRLHTRSFNSSVCDLISSGRLSTCAIMLFCLMVCSPWLHYIIKSWLDRVRNVLTMVVKICILLRRK